MNGPDRYTVRCVVNDLIDLLIEEGVKKEDILEVFQDVSDADKEYMDMTWLEAHRADTQDVENLHVKNWLDREITGNNVMYSFFTTRTMRRGHGWDR